jgi:hypothetical protein
MDGPGCIAHPAIWARSPQEETVRMFLEGKIQTKMDLYA